MILTRKHPSAEVKPANHWGSLIPKSKTLGLVWGIVFEKAASKAEGRPQFREALKATSLRNPSRVKCSLRMFKCLFEQIVISMFLSY